MKKLLMGGVILGLMLMAGSAQAAELTVCAVGCDHTTLQEAVDAANTDGSDIIMLSEDITVSEQVTVENPVTINGNGNTLFASFAKTDSDNNSAIGIAGTTGVVIENITLDGTGGSAWPLQLHGVNVYLSTGVNLNSVTITNFMGSGVVVNGSNVTATNLNTSGNSWNAVNVDPGLVVTEPSVFTLSSGTLGENAQIWSDGANVTQTATVAVNAEGYTEYSIDGTSKKLWSNKSVVNRATIGNVIYPTIQAAITAAVEGDTINIGAGTYAENILLDKTGISLQGAGVGQTVINPASGNGIELQSGADTASISELTLEGHGGDRGIISFSGSNTALTLSNVRSENWTSGVYLNSGSSATITGYEGVGNVAGIGNDPGVTGLTITGSTFSGNSDEGIGWQSGTGVTPIIRSSSFSGNGHAVAVYTAWPDHYEGDDVFVDALENWWDDMFGPGNTVTDGVAFDPWCVDSGCLHLSNEAPVITLEGGAAMGVWSSNGFVEPGATATDSLGNSVDVTDDSSSSNFHEPGSYTITYTATDIFDNTATTSRTVSVRASSGGRGGGSFSQGEVLGETTGPADEPLGNEVLGAFDIFNMSEEERQDRIKNVTSQLISKMNELIGLLQSQLAAALQAQGN